MGVEERVRRLKADLEALLASKDNAIDKSIAKQMYTLAGKVNTPNITGLQVMKKVLKGLTDLEGRPLKLMSEDLWDKYQCDSKVEEYAVGEQGYVVPGCLEKLEDRLAFLFDHPKAFRQARRRRNSSKARVAVVCEGTREPKAGNGKTLKDVSSYYGLMSQTLAEECSLAGDELHCRTTWLMRRYYSQNEDVRQLVRKEGRRYVLSNEDGLRQVLKKLIQARSERVLKKTEVTLYSVLAKLLKEHYNGDGVRFKYMISGWRQQLRDHPALKPYLQIQKVEGGPRYVLNDPERSEEIIRNLLFGPKPKTLRQIVREMLEESQGQEEQRAAYVIERVKEKPGFASYARKVGRMFEISDDEQLREDIRDILSHTQLKGSRTYTAILHKAISEELRIDEESARSKGPRFSSKCLRDAEVQKYIKKVSTGKVSRFEVLDARALEARFRVLIREHFSRDRKGLHVESANPAGVEEAVETPASDTPTPVQAPIITDTPKAAVSVEGRGKKFISLLEQLLGEKKLTGPEFTDTAYMLRRLLDENKEVKDYLSGLKELSSIEAIVRKAVSDLPETVAPNSKPKQMDHYFYNLLKHKLEEKFKAKERELDYQIEMNKKGLLIDPEIKKLIKRIGKSKLYWTHDPEKLLILLENKVREHQRPVPYLSVFREVYGISELGPLGNLHKLKNLFLKDQIVRECISRDGTWWQVTDREKLVQRLGELKKGEKILWLHDSAPFAIPGEGKAVRSGEAPKYDPFKSQIPVKGIGSEPEKLSKASIRKLSQYSLPETDPKEKYETALQNAVNSIEDLMSSESAVVRKDVLDKMRAFAKLLPSRNPVKPGCGEIAYAVYELQCTLKNSEDMQGNLRRLLAMSTNILKSSSREERQQLKKVVLDYFRKNFNFDVREAEQLMTSACRFITSRPDCREYLEESSAGYKVLNVFAITKELDASFGSTAKEELEERLREVNNTYLGSKASKRKSNGSAPASIYHLALAAVDEVADEDKLRFSGREVYEKTREIFKLYGPRVQASLIADLEGKILNPISVKNQFKEYARGKKQPEKEETKSAEEAVAELPEIAGEEPVFDL